MSKRKYYRKDPYNRSFGKCGLILMIFIAIRQ